MAKLKLLSIGEIKESSLLEQQNEYVKRIKKYAPFESIEVKDSLIAEKDLNKYRQFLDSTLASKKGSRDQLILLDRRGKSYSSQDFSKLLEKKMSQGDVLFWIGGSTGFFEEQLKMADEVISFSTMTFPHKLFRLMLLEQIYRAFAILKNEPYAK